MMRIHGAHAFVWGCIVLGVLAACGGGGGGGPVSYVGEERSALIEAMKGGDVAVGAVKVAVPADALEKDTRLSVTARGKKDYPDREHVAIDVYEMGPAGTKFTKDVELTFDLEGVKVGKDQRARVAELDEEANVWKPLPNSKVVGGRAVATTKHFSFYTVLLEEIPSGGAYEPIICDADFSPCGGDLTGTWEFTEGCVTGFSQSNPIPPLSGDSCAAATGGFEVSVSGSAHFGTEQEANIDQIVIVTSSFSYPLACLEDISRASGTPLTCDMIGGMVEGRSCSQTSSSGDISSSFVGSYTSEGGTLSLTATDGDYVLIGLGTLNPEIDYCVRDDKLTLRVRDTTAGAEPQVYEATRSPGS